MAASQSVSLPLAIKHIDPLVMAHETISDLAFLFTIWSTELTMADPFQLGKECFFWISCVTIVNVHHVLRKLILTNR